MAEHVPESSGSSSTPPTPQSYDAVPVWLQAHLEDLVAGELGPRELAARTGRSLTEIAEWAAEPSGARLLETLARLEDYRTRMVVARYRVNAAAVLIGLSTQREDVELARKACVDLLRIAMDTMPPSGAEAPNGTTVTPPDEAAIITALEALGEAK